MIIIIQGPPASGKTTLASNLSEKLSLPCLSKDSISESLFDSMTPDNQKQREEIGNASYNLLFKLAGSLSKGTGDFIVESDFNPTGGAARMEDTLRDSKHEILEIYLTASSPTLLKRYEQRWNLGNRHQGHADDTRLVKLEKHLGKMELHRPLSISKHILRFDTERETPDAILERVLEEIA